MVVARPSSSATLGSHLTFSRASMMSDALRRVVDRQRPGNELRLATDRLADLLDEIVAHDAARPMLAPDPASLATLATDLKTVGAASTTDARLKKRITLIQEVIATSIRIKECQFDFFADRTSAATMQANQLRPWCAPMAYVLLEGLRRISPRVARTSSLTCGSIRLKLFKIAAALVAH